MPASLTPLVVLSLMAEMHAVAAVVVTGVAGMEVAVEATEGVVEGMVAAVGVGRGGAVMVVGVMGVTVTTVIWEICVRDWETSTVSFSRYEVTLTDSSGTEEFSMVWYRTVSWSSTALCHTAQMSSVQSGIEQYHGTAQHGAILHSLVGSGRMVTYTALGRGGKDCRYSNRGWGYVPVAQAMTGRGQRCADNPWHDYHGTNRA
jgi:hypothetical protein